MHQTAAMIPYFSRRLLLSIALLTVMLSLAFAGAARADGLIIIEHPPIPPHPWPHPMPPVYSFAPLEVQYHHVNARISDQVAVTEVDQAFYNPNDQRLEGTYIFPLPRGARIDKFSMDIDGKTMEAELLDADKARGIYEDIVRRMKDPALLEYAGQALFKLRIYPIEPRSTKRIQLKYTELLAKDSGSIRYLYPLNTEKFSAAPLREVAVKVVLETKQALRSIYSPTHTVEIARQGDKAATVGYEAKNIKPDTDFQLFFATHEDSDLSFSVLNYNDGSDPQGGFFLLLAAPSAKSESAPSVPKDLIFVLDTSGSMYDDNKLDQAKRALNFCLKNLNAGDRFNIIRFSTEAELLSADLLDVAEANIQKAQAFLDGLKPIGGTAIEDALTRAVTMGRGVSGARPVLIVFLTDGMPTVGATDENQIINAVTKQMGDRPYRIFSFGVGHDVNTNLLDRLAEKTRAVSQYILPKEDLEIKLSNFYSKIAEPALTGLKLTASGGVTLTKLEPHELPDLFKGEQLVMLGRYQGRGQAALTIEGGVNGETRRYTQEFSFADQATEQAFIPQLWASRRVGYLLDQIRINGESQEVRDEVVELARKYGIVTPYTAYLIVEDESHRGVPTEGRIMRELSQAPGVREDLGGMYRSVERDKSGAAAVGKALSFNALRQADSLGAPAEAKMFALKGAAQDSAAEAKEVEHALQKQESRFVGGRTFYRNGNVWIDSLISERRTDKHVKITFNSDEYFQLMKKHADVPRWLALGKEVQFVLDGVVYETTAS